MFGAAATCRKCRQKGSAIAREGLEVDLAALQEHSRYASMQMHGRVLLMILDEVQQTRKTAAEEERKRTVAEKAEKMRKLEANATRRQQQEQRAQERARRQAPEEHARKEHALRTLADMGSTDTMRNTALLETLHYDVDQVIDELTVPPAPPFSCAVEVAGAAGGAEDVLGAEGNNECAAGAAGGAADALGSFRRQRICEGNNQGNNEGNVEFEGNNECAICLGDQRSTAFVPCGHRFVCSTCAGKFRTLQHTATHCNILQHTATHSCPVDINACVAGVQVNSVCIQQMCVANPQMYRLTMCVHTHAHNNKLNKKRGCNE